MDCKKHNYPLYYCDYCVDDFKATLRTGLVECAERRAQLEGNLSDAHYRISYLKAQLKDAEEVMEAARKTIDSDSVYGGVDEQLNNVWWEMDEAYRAKYGEGE